MTDASSSLQTTFAWRHQREQVLVTSSDAVWVLSKEYALIHESIDLHADYHRVVILQSSSVIWHTHMHTTH